MLFNPDNIPHIPAELRALSQWVNWHYETRKGKPTKVPLNPRTSLHASSTNPKTWGTFEAAVLRAAGKPHIGVGFVLTPPYIGVDLDKCAEGESVSAFAQEVLQRCKDTYAEWSPSGLGIHQYVKGVLPHAVNKRGELYQEGRFFTVTGQRLDGHPTTIAQASDEDVSWLMRHFGSDEKDAERGIVEDIDPDAAVMPDLLAFEALCDLEPGFRATWERTKKFKSDSESEMSLARYAVLGGWDDQAVYGLLVAWRRKYGLEAKHHKGLLLTIAKAHGVLEEEEEARALDTLAEAPEKERRSSLGKLLGLPIVRLVQMGQHDAAFRVYLEGGAVVNVGDYDQVVSLKRWQRIVFEHTGQPLTIHTRKWGKLWPVLIKMRQMEESPHTGQSGETWHWIEDFLHNVEGHPDEAETVRQGNSFQDSAFTYINLDKFLRHVGIMFHMSLPRNTVANRLCVIGWEEVLLERIDEKSLKPVKKYYYRHTR